MDLKIKDVAELLHISETTVRRWLLARIIPAYKLNGQYRFSRIEIENWMMKQKLSSEEKKKFSSNGEKQVYPADTATQLGNQQFALYRAINRGGVFQGVKGETKEEVIRQTMSYVAEKMGLDSDVLSELLLDRERLMPTALNHGIAVPHARECLQKVPFDLVAVVFPEKPIEYGALDGKPVDILFFLFATEDKTHLRLLAKIAHLSSDEKFLTLLHTHPEKTDLLEHVRNWESTLQI